MPRRRARRQSAFERCFGPETSSRGRSRRKSNTESDFERCFGPETPQKRRYRRDDYGYETDGGDYISFF